MSWGASKSSWSVRWWTAHPTHEINVFSKIKQSLFRVYQRYQQKIHSIYIYSYIYIYHITYCIILCNNIQDPLISNINHYMCHGPWYPQDAFPKTWSPSMKSASKRVPTLSRAGGTWIHRGSMETAVVQFIALGKGECIISKCMIMYHYGIIEK